MNDLSALIAQTAQSLGINPLDLATVISYETAGTFDPSKRGPTTQYGQHRGLIQFGEPQARQYGVNWADPVNSQLGPQGAVAKYMRDAGVKPGMGLMDVYSAVNAGRVGRYNASDANNGGAPGTVADKVNNQMAGHRQKAEALLGGNFTAPQVPATNPAVNASPAMQPDTQRPAKPDNFAEIMAMFGNGAGSGPQGPAANPGVQVVQSGDPFQATMAAIEAANKAKALQQVPDVNQFLALGKKPMAPLA